MFNKDNNDAAGRTLSFLDKVTDKSYKSGTQAGHTAEVAQQHQSDTEEKEEVFDESVLGEKGFLDRAFKEPKSGSFIMKMKKGDLSGKQASSHYEKLIGDIILAFQSGEFHKELYLISRMAVGQTNALKIAEAALTAQKSGVPDEVLYKHLFNDKLTGIKDIGNYFRKLLPYHKDIVMKHAGFFARIGLGF